MITQKTLTYLASFLNFTAFLKISPIWWNPETQTLSSELTVFHHIAWKIAGVHCVFYHIYSILRFITEVKNGSQNYIELSIILQFSIAYLWSSLAYYNLYNRKDAMVVFFTHLTSFDTLLEGKLKNSRKSSKWTASKILELTIILYIMQIISLFAVLTLMYLATFRNKTYVISLFSSDPSWKTMLIFFPFEVMSKLSLIYPIYSVGMYMQIYTLAIPYWLDILSSMKEDALRTIPLFQKLSVLNTYFNKSLNSSYIPTKYSMLGILIVCPTAAAIRLYGRVHWGTFLILPTCALSCLTGSTLIIYAAALVYERSLHFIKTLRANYRLGPIARRYTRSLRPFGVRVGFLRVVKYLYLFAFYLAVSNYIISLLISFPESYF